MKDYGFTNLLGKRQHKILSGYGIQCDDWTVSEASLAIKLIAENNGVVPEGMDIDYIDNHYELSHPTYPEDFSINEFSREIFIEGREDEYDGTYTVVDHTEVEGRKIFELESDNYGFVKIERTKGIYEITRGHLIVDEHLNVLFEGKKDFIYDSEFRVCSECGNIMINGFVVEGTYEYYCSDECLHKHYTEEEYENMYEEDEAYWTQWY